MLIATSWQLSQSSFSLVHLLNYAIFDEGKLRTLGRRLKQDAATRPLRIRCQAAHGCISTGMIKFVSNFSLSGWASRTWKLVVVMTTTASSSGSTKTLLPPEPAIP